MAEEPQDLAPIATKILYEDDEVRIWDQRLDVGEVLHAHRHDHDYVLVDVAGDKVVADTLPGTVSSHHGHFELDVKRGRTYFVEKGAIEEAKNTGTLPYRAILVEFKKD